MKISLLVIIKLLDAKKVLFLSNHFCDAFNRKFVKASLFMFCLKISVCEKHLLYRLKIFII
jgi:hypothetical protein